MIRFFFFFLSALNGGRTARHESTQSVLQHASFRFRSPTGNSEAVPLWIYHKGVRRRRWYVWLPPGEKILHLHRLPGSKCTVCLYSKLFCCLLTNLMFWQNDGLHFRQPWVMGVQQEIERLKLKFLEQEKLLRECEALKVSFLLNVATNFYNLSNILFCLWCLFRFRLRCFLSVCVSSRESAEVSALNPFNQQLKKLVGTCVCN